MSEIRRESDRVEGLTIHRVTATAHPRLLFLICHGYGAPGTDLVPIGAELIRSSAEIASNIEFVFPEAPLLLGGMAPFDSRAWWQIDLQALDQAMARGDTLDRREECPDDLPKVREQVNRILQHELKRVGLDESRVILGGFSQGAMLATDLALHMPSSPAFLFAYSGTLLCESTWRNAASARRGLRVFQSHGRQDPLLPFRAAEWLRDLLVESGLEVEFCPFDGPHTIPVEALLGSRSALETLVRETSKTTETTETTETSETSQEEGGAR